MIKCSQYQSVRYCLWMFCFVVKAKKQILFPVSLIVIQVLIRYCFGILSPGLLAFPGKLVSIDLEALIAEKHKCGKCL